MNVMKRILTYSAIASLALFGACKKKYDEPPIKTIPTGNILTCAEVRALYTGTPVKITDELSVYGVVTADEASSGNFYKEFYMQDQTAALNIRLTSAGSAYVGDSIRLFLQGAVISEYNGFLQVDSVDFDNQIIKQAVGANVENYITDVTIGQIDPTMQARLVRVSNVQFLSAELGSTYADPVNFFSENRTIEDCSANTVLLRSSGYSNFAGDTIPDGNGTITAIVGQYNTDMQLLLNEVDDVQFNSARCGATGCPAVNALNESWGTQTNNVDIAVNCWTNVSVQGSRVWRAKEFSGNLYAQATAYQSGETNETWLISPEISFAGTDTLEFNSSQAFWDHNGLTVWISTDFTGSVSSATWTQVTCTLAGSGDGNYTWVPSGKIDIQSYVGGTSYSGNYVIAFKYLGTDGATDTNYQIDDIVLTQ